MAKPDARIRRNEGDNLYGDGVNFSARIEALAEPGSISLSGKFHDYVCRKLVLLREFEIHTSKGKTIVQSASQIGMTENSGTSHFNGEMFTSLKEAQILTDR